MESNLISRAEQMGPSAILQKAPLLSSFAPRFINWFENAPSLSAKTRRYYRVGLARIIKTELTGMTLDRITTEQVDLLGLDGSPAYVNQGLRTLRRLLGKAVEWRVIASAPSIKLAEEQGRELTINAESEAKLLAVGKQPMKDVLVIVQDTGMRPDEVFRIRIENIDWSRRLIFNSHGKTRASRACTNQPAHVRSVDGSRWRKTGRLAVFVKASCERTSDNCCQAVSERHAAGLVYRKAWSCTVRAIRLAPQFTKPRATWRWL